jgi:hypothetical protein
MVDAIFVAVWPIAAMSVVERGQALPFNTMARPNQFPTSDPKRFLRAIEVVERSSMDGHLLLE